MQKLKCINGLTLKIIAMVLMLGDHMWASVLPDALFLTLLGRLAFPIFAYQMVEGYFHTSSVKRMITRLLVFALLSEIPFNLLAGASWYYPFHQNVMFTLLMGILLVHGLEQVKKKGVQWQCRLAAVCAVFVGSVAGTLAMVDYMGFGVITVLLFYFFRQQKYAWVGQLFGLYYLNVVLMGGRVLPVTLGFLQLEIPTQGFAVLSLVLIWMYNHKSGPHSKGIQLAYYSFYPLHMLVLYGVGLLLAK